MLEKMYQKGLDCLDADVEKLGVASGFSYPADYNHLHLHLALWLLFFLVSPLATSMRYMLLICHAR